jgi:Tfp pilus assembly ATPase PilU
VNPSFESTAKLGIEYGHVSPVSRFRVNVFRQRGSAGMVIRRVKAEVSSLELIAGHTERDHHVEAWAGAGGGRNRIR